MKILKLIIKDYQQFKNIELDFTNPVTGEPLDKVCFIGRNATGKSTILWILNEFINNSKFEKGILIFNVLIDNKKYYSIYLKNKNYWFTSDIELINNWLDIVTNENSYQKSNLTNKVSNFEKYLLKENFIKKIFVTNLNDLFIYCPPESSENNYLFDNVPKTNLNEALNYFKKISTKYIVSQDTVKDFWKLLIFQLQLREKNLKEYAIKNKTLSYEKIVDEFNLLNPNILTKISEIWNKILERANLYFDIENIETPISLTENLVAYIKDKKTQEIVNYNKLSTGIRNFIFKIGHIYSLYFNRKIENGFLLIDEPENSLFPDFLYDLIDEVYVKEFVKNNNTQFFISTHNPIIATQFEPYERIILDFDDDSYVYARKGTVPVGDDPNDILEVDFGMRNLMTREGIKKYKEYQNLRKELRKTTDESKKIELLAQISKIGNDYNLPE